MANIKGFLGAAGVAAAASLAMSSAALADDAPKFGYSLTITGVSDYLFRGITLTNHDPAFEPYLELTYGIAYLGFWGSNIHSDSPNHELYDLRPFEFDLYAGIRPVTGPVNWDIGVLWYTYPSSPVDYDYVEFKVSATTTPITNLTVGFNAFATPDQGLSTPTTETIEGTAAYTLPNVAMFTPTVSGLIGYTHAPDGSGWFLLHDDYTYWNAGVKLTVDKYFMDFRYYGTNINDDPDHLGRDEFLFSAGVTLP